MCEVIKFPELKEALPEVNVPLECALDKVEAIILPFTVPYKPQDTNDNYRHFAEFNSDALTGMMLENLNECINRVSRRPIIDVVEQKNFNDLCKASNRIRNLIIHAMQTKIKEAKSEIQ